MKHNVDNAWKRFNEYKQKESNDSNLNDEFKRCIENLKHENIMMTMLYCLNI